MYLSLLHVHVYFSFSKLRGEGRDREGGREGRNVRGGGEYMDSVCTCTYM